MSPTAQRGATAAATTPVANSEVATAEIPHRETAGQGHAAAGGGELLGIGAAAARTGVSERALRYYQQIGLLVPACTTPGGLRRYSADDLARVARIRELQTLLGLNLDEIAVVLCNEDRVAQIRLSYRDERTSDEERQQLARESLALAEELRATVQAKRDALDGFLADLDTRISRTRALLAATGPVTSPSPPASDG